MSEVITPKRRESAVQCDPQPGDVAQGKGIERKVIRRFEVCGEQFVAWEHVTTLSEWKRWFRASKARVK